MKNLSKLSLAKYLSWFRYSGKLNPERDWLVLIGIAVVIFIASIGWNVWFFISLANVQSTPAKTVTAPTASSATSVTNVQNIFKARAAEQNNYQQAYHFVDPSLSGS